MRTTISGPLAVSRVTVMDRCIVTLIETGGGDDPVHEKSDLRAAPIQWHCTLADIRQLAVRLMAASEVVDEEIEERVRPLVEERDRPTVEEFGLGDALQRYAQTGGTR